MWKFFLITTFLIHCSYAATIVEELELRETENFRDIRNAGRREENFRDFIHGETQTPLRFVYLMEERLPRKDYWERRNANLNDARTIFEDALPMKSPYLNKGSLHLDKRSVSMDADLLGLPDVDIDTRMHGHENSQKSQSSLGNTHSIKKRSSELQKELDIDLLKSEKLLSNFGREIKFVQDALRDKNVEKDIDIDLLQKGIDVDLTKSLEIPKNNRHDRLVDTVFQKDLNIDLMEKEINVDPSKSHKMPVENEKSSHNSGDRLNDKTIQNDIGILQKEINVDLSKLNEILQRNNEFPFNKRNQHSDRSEHNTYKTSHKDLYTDLLHSNKKQSTLEQSEISDEKKDYKILESYSENQSKNNFYGSSSSTSYKQYNKENTVNINRMRYHTNNKDQTGLLNSRFPATGGQSGTRNIVGTQNLKKEQTPLRSLNSVSFKSTRDLIDLNERSRNEGSELLERDGNLISIGNPLPSLGLLLGLQAGSRSMKHHHVNENQAQPQIPIRSENLLGAQNKQRSIGQHLSNDVNSRSKLENEGIAKDGTLLSIGNPLPPLGVLLGVQTGRKYSKTPTNFNDNKKTLTGIQERNDDLITVGNLLPPVGLQVGLQAGRKSPRTPIDFNDKKKTVTVLQERDGDLLTIGNPLPSVDAQLGLQVGKSFH